MKSITRNIVGPESKLYSAKFSQAENMGEVGDVITSLGLSLSDVNEALRKAKKALYLASLESTPEEAKQIAETKRASLGSGLPVGLTDLNRVSKRGRKSEADKAAEVAASTPKPKLNKTGK